MYQEMCYILWNLFSRLSSIDVDNFVMHRGSSLFSITFVDRMQIAHVDFCPISILPLEQTNAANWLPLATTTIYTSESDDSLLRCIVAMLMLGVEIMHST